MIRILFIISLSLLASCGNVKKEESKINDQEKAAEVATPEGIVIQVQTETDTLKGSPKAYAVGKIGDTNFTINYYSPATRGRMIWGGLVAHGNVWVTGAHKATSVEFDKDIKIGETLVSKGKYAFFTIPGETQWTIILNKNWNQHLADDYNQADDILRLSVTPETEETHQERLRYVIEEESATKGEIVMYWDKLEVSVPFEVIN